MKTAMLWTLQFVLCFVGAALSIVGVAVVYNLGGPLAVLFAVLAIGFAARGITTAPHVQVDSRDLR